MGAMIRGDAINATTDPKYAIARSNAEEEGLRIRPEREEALSHLTSDDKANIQQSTRIPWIAQLKASPKPHWGIICFRTAYDDDDAWTAYKEHLLHCSRAGLWVYPGTDYVGKKWKIEFVEDEKERLDGASVEDLCVYACCPPTLYKLHANSPRYFNNPPPSSPITSHISSGLRNDLFLFADSRTISSLHEPADDPSLKGWTPAPGAPPFNTDHLIRGYGNAVDASYNSEKTYANGFKGVLKVHPAHLATTFYHRLEVRGEEPEEEAAQWWRLKQEWETMFKVASGSGGRKGGIYPPRASWNR